MPRVNEKSTTYLCQQGAPWLGYYYSGFQCLLDIGSTYPLMPNDSLQHNKTLDECYDFLTNRGKRAGVWSLYF